ncbi:MAG: hypothetical protein KatS3mg118_2829 [Paracoccaceae bacterium]|nr:MAG: hypothetical protein KatS3mg118_2829 [Paracoccaceae bacterium]
MMPPDPPLLPGDPAPWLVQATLGNPRFHFHTAAGRWLVLGMFGRTDDSAAAQAIAAVRARPDLFGDVRASFFGMALVRHGAGSEPTPPRAASPKASLAIAGSSTRMAASAASMAR